MDCNTRLHDLRVPCPCCTRSYARPDDLATGPFARPLGSVSREMEQAHRGEDGTACPRAS